jgi:hypothetical protein
MTTQGGITIFNRVVADRADWEAATRVQRHLAVTADAELRRRHPGQRFTPLRSAERPAATDAHRAELALTAGQDIPEPAPRRMRSWRRPSRNPPPGPGPRARPGSRGCGW